MQKHIRYTRLFLITLGVLTVLVSFVVICRATTLLRAWQGDALYSASVVVFLLGVLLAIGGGCLVLHARKYGSSSALGCDHPEGHG
jgi:hypothetical protein